MPSSCPNTECGLLLEQAYFFCPKCGRRLAELSLSQVQGANCLHLAHGGRTFRLVQLEDGQPARPVTVSSAGASLHEHPEVRGLLPRILDALQRDQVKRDEHGCWILMFR